MKPQLSVKIALDCRIHCGERGKEKKWSLSSGIEITLKKSREYLNASAHQPITQEKPEPAHHPPPPLSPTIRRDTFETVAREWFDTKKSAWAKSHADRILRRLETHLFPLIGPIPVAEITPGKLLDALRTAENRGIGETAHRCLQTCGQILRYAVVTERCERDISTDLRGALAPVRGQHFAAILDKKKLAGLLIAIDHYPGSPTVKIALKMAPLVFVRPGELRQMRWRDVDFDDLTWRYEATKTKTPHIVPLSRQVVSLLREAQTLDPPKIFVFPAPRFAESPLSDAAMIAALRRLGYSSEEQTIHGFRAIARTLLDEELKFKPELIEHQLAHTVRDPLGRAYNRTQHLAERREMMQAWADWLEGLKVQYAASIQ